MDPKNHEIYLAVCIYRGKKILSFLRYIHILKKSLGMIDFRDISIDKNPIDQSLAIIARLRTEAQEAQFRSRTLAVFDYVTSRKLIGFNFREIESLLSDE